MLNTTRIASYSTYIVPFLTASCSHSPIIIPAISLPVSTTPDLSRTKHTTMGCGSSKPDPSPAMNSQPVASPNNDAWAAEQYRKEQAKKKKTVRQVQVQVQVRGVYVRSQTNPIAEETR
jgi:hypothetical protein